MKRINLAMEKEIQIHFMKWFYTAVYTVLRYSVKHSVNIYTGVDDLLCRGSGGAPKRIATVVRFSEFFFCLKDIQK